MWLRQQAATHMSLTGRGLPRLTAAAESRPQVAAIASSPGMTAIPASQAASSPSAAFAPVADLCPLGQLAEGDEGNEGFAADQPCGSGPVRLRRCRSEATSVSRTVGFTAGGSGQLAVTFGVSERQEVVQFLVRLEGVRSQVIERSDRPGVLSRQQLSGRPPWPSRRASRAVCTRCTHPNLQALAGLIATHQHRRRGLPMLSHMAVHSRCDLPSVTNTLIRPHQIGDDLSAETGRSDPAACPRSEHLQ